MEEEQAYYDDEPNMFIRFLIWMWIWFVGSLIAGGVFWFATILHVNLFGGWRYDIDPPMFCTKVVSTELSVVDGKGKSK